MSYYNTPDLASILHTLSTYTPAPQPELPVVGYPPQQQAPPPLEDGELPFEPPYEPAEIPYEPQAITAHEQPVATPLSYEPRQPQPSALPTHQLQSQLPPPYQPTHQQPLIPSASTITSWPSALRHVTMHLAHNEEVMFRIKRLISAQHDHERQWWAQREALLKTQRGRDEERRKLDGVLYVITQTPDDWTKVAFLMPATKQISSRRPHRPHNPCPRSHKRESGARPVRQESVYRMSGDGSFDGG